MATYTKTVDPNGSADYLSISLWEAGEQSLYTSGDIAVADCKRTGSSVDTDSVVIQGWTTGVLPRIVANSAHRHNGIKGAGYILRPTSGHTLRCYQPVEVDGIEFDFINTSFQVFNSGGTALIANSLLYNQGGRQSAGNSISFADYTYRNCIFFDVGATSLWASRSLLLSAHTDNCTIFVKSGDGASTGRYIRDAVCRNTMVFDVDNDKSIDLFSSCTGDYNVSTDASAPGTTVAINQTSYATYFVNTATNDFHLKDASGTLFGIASDNLSATFTDDIDGDTRPASTLFGLGADFYVAAVGGVTGSGSHQATTSTHTSSGTRTVSGSSEHTATTATHSASGSVSGEITGSGSHQANTATHSAIGERAVSGSSSHQATTATHAAIGERSIIGSASHQASTSTQASTGKREVTGTGAHTAQTATHTATGSVGGVITGSGNHAANDATHSAAGLRIVGGTATHQASTSTQASTGTRSVKGSSNHQANTTTQSASGSVGNVVSGTGSHAAQTSTQIATGSRTVNASGNHQAETSTQTSTGTTAGQITGTGSHQATRATQTGVLLRVIQGSGSHQASTATQAAQDLPLVQIPDGARGISDITSKNSIKDISKIYGILKLG